MDPGSSTPNTPPSHPYTPDQQSLLDFIDEVNGQDAYSTEACALGKITKREYLALPNNITLPVIPAHEVGTKKATDRFPKEALFQVYALNKARAPEGENAIRYGLLRMEAVKMGWVSGQREVVSVPPDPTASATFFVDGGDIRANCNTAQTAAYIIPLVAEHAFRTMGHHYLTGQAKEYEDRYSKTIRACLVPEVLGFMRPTTLYHHALHWVSPARAREVLAAQLNTGMIPDALKIRYNAAPAGTAIITTTAAVLRAMAASGLRDEIANVGGFDLDKIETATEKIKEDAPAFHKMAFAFGASPPSPEVLRLIEEAKAEASRFAPISQAFINSLFRDSALFNAKALAKHSDENPMLRKRAERFFREASRKEISSVKDLFLNNVII